MAEGRNENHTNGSGQSVNVVISSGSVKWLVVAVLAFVALLIFTNRTASQAEMRAGAAQKASEDAATEYRVTQIWLQRASVACEKAGVSIPPIPASLLK